MPSFGSCLCCNRTIGYDKINLCKDCEKKYIDAIKKYVREKGIIGQNGRKTVELETIKEDLGISTKVLSYFSEEGVLDLIFNDEEIPEEKESSNKNRTELIRNLQVYGNELKKNQQTLEKNNLPSGPRMHTRHNK